MTNPVFSVSDVTKVVKHILEEDQQLSFMLVRGEISNYKPHRSGHIYFTLKDDYARIRCVMFKNSARFLRFKPDNGMKVLLQGRLSVYERQGDYQIIVDGLYEEGLGSLHIEYERLKQRLLEQGLFEDKHKQDIPLMPRKIGIMSALGSAALTDIISTVLRKYPVAQLVVAPVLVQGPLAADDMIQKLAMLQQVSDVDVIIISRGGGSIEDLWSFNDERLVRAIFETNTPVITAVGHEVDTTLVDYVADQRVATPTAAGEMVVPDLALLLQDLNQREYWLEHQMSACLVHLEDKLAQASLRLQQLAPHQRFKQQLLALDHLEKQLANVWLKTIQNVQQRLLVLETKLSLLNPTNLLQRGYALVRKLPEASMVQSIEDVKSSQIIQICLQDGQIIANVVKIEAKDDGYEES